MWSRQLFLIWFFTLTILTTQSHVIHKRGVLSKMFGGRKDSTQDVDADMSPRERSKFRELLKNPVVISMITAAVGMVVQQALASKNMNNVCDNKYVKMAYMAGNMQPQIQQVLNLLGCNSPNRKYDGGSSNTNAGKKYGISTTPSYGNNEDEEESDNQNDNNNNNNNEDTLESSITKEKQSKVQQLLSIARGEKGAKRNFLKSLFGLSKKDKTFTQGHKLPSSTYKLDKDDANSMKNLEKELEQSHKNNY